ncbi:hypothetical protein MTF65_06410 [Streptomyces sp. APSN-46.1]|uniref:hypothetical protein n=1 Tax=Streptomyces sp. APSN-46.1 TaxID=2929049 RepID=UPI001FB2FAA1|nr:hypothetical protein [Streptomyces sp. APSN-46.1]MCJ1676981.1 hypothetical protein [Streptomyces sp. APSN-46.1]
MSNRVETLDTCTRWVVLIAKREPNGRLRTLLANARWSGQDFARAVNGVAAEAGLTLRYDRTSVSHWLAGTRPPAHVVALAAEALSRRTGRRVSAAETGLSRHSGPGTRDSPGGEPPGVDAFAAASPEAGARPDLGAGLLGEIPVYSSAWRPPGPGPEPGPEPGPVSGLVPGLETPPPPTSAGQGGRDRIGPHHVEAADAVLPVFRNADMMFGSGHARPALIAYLTTTVAPWLRADASPSVRHRLLGSTSRLAYTAGFLCFDSNQQGMAQAYYRAALRLGREAGDPRCHAPALRGMSVQAHHLGHRKQALELAEAAAREAPRLPDVQAAFVTGQLAVAEAACGDRRAALAHLTGAERMLERAGGQSAPIGDYHRAALAHQQAEALAALGDIKGAVAALTSSLRHRPPAERRARAITAARLAELHLQRGHLERACAAWHELLDTVPQLESARVADALRRMRGRLRAVRASGVVRPLLERAGVS